MSKKIVPAVSAERSRIKEMASRCRPSNGGRWVRDKRLLQNFLQRLRSQQRDQPWNKLRILVRFDDQRQLHRWRGHLHRRLRALIEGAIDDVRPTGSIPRPEAGSKPNRVSAMWGDEAGAGGVCRVIETPVDETAVLQTAQVLGVVFWSQKGAEVVIEPPCQAGRGRILEVDNGVFIPGEIVILEQGPRPMHQTVVLVFYVGANALPVKTGKQRGRAGSVETAIVIEDAHLQSLKLPILQAAATLRRPLSSLI